MASKPTVMLTLAGDESQLTKAFAKVGASSLAMSSSVDRASGRLDSMRTAVDRLDRSLDGVNDGLGSMAKLAGSVANLGAAVNLMYGLGAATAAASGALLALPAAGVAAAGVAATVKLGMDGITRSVEGLNKSLDPLKAQVSGAFERGLAPAVDSLNQTLPKLSGRLTGIASDLSAIGVEAAHTVALPENIATLNGALGSTSGLLDGARRATGPLIQAFLDIVSVGTGGFDSIGDSIAHAAEGFASFIRDAKESGKLQNWMQQGIAAVKEFMDIVQDMGVIVLSVFQGISEGAGGMGSTLGPAITAVKEFVTSVPGQDFLRSIGAALAAIGTAVAMVLTPALEAVTPLLGPLATLFAAVVTQVAALVAPIIDYLAPGLEMVAGFIADNVEWLAPLATALGVATVAVKLFNAALWANPVLIFIGLLGMLVAAIANLWQRSEAFRNFFIGMWNGIRNTISSVVNWIKNAWNGVVSFFAGLPSRIGAALGSLGSVIKNAFKSAVNVMIDALNWGIDRLNDVITGANHLNPFSDIPHIPHISRLHTGGVVPGMPGSEQLAILQAGERVVNRGQTARDSGVTVTFSGDTDGAFATAFQRMVRAGKIQIASA